MPEVVVGTSLASFEAFALGRSPRSFSVAVRGSTGRGSWWGARPEAEPWTGTMTMNIDKIDGGFEFEHDERSVFMKRIKRRASLLLLLPGFFVAPSVSRAQEHAYVGSQQCRKKRRWQPVSIPIRTIPRTPSVFPVTRWAIDRRVVSSTSRKRQTTPALDVKCATVRA